MIKDNSVIKCWSWATDVAIPNSVTSIGYQAFGNCSGLTSITIPNSVTSIGSSAFWGCSGLTSIEIPNSVTSMGDQAFEKCSGLTSINIPNSLVSIGDYEFNYCTSLTSINVEAGNTKYDSRNNCNAIIDTESNTLIAGCQNTTIPSSVVSIGIGAFRGCTGLTSIIIPNSVSSIGNQAFENCSDLKNITIPNSVTSIGSDAFRGSGWYDAQSDGILYIDNWLICYKGSEPTGEIIIKNGTKGLASYAFHRCYGLTSVTIPNSVISIGHFAFCECDGLSSITIPNSVASIGDDAFLRCSGLTSITIPNSVASIGYCAFSECNGLSSVISDIEEPFVFGSSAFSWISNDCVLTVPYSTRDAYITAGWTEDIFKGGVVEMPEEDTDISGMDNVIYLEPTEAKTGSQKSLSIKMKNTAAIRGFQFDLYLPEGVNVAKTAKGKIVGSLSSGRLPEEDEHSLTFSEQADGAIRFLCSSQYDETFTGNDGEIATLTVNIADNMADGDYPIVMKNMKLTETDISKYYETPYLKSTLTILSYTIGDINNDGVVDVSDYTGVANHIHGNTPTGFNTHAADVDENGSIDVSDYTGIANIIHTGSIYGGANVRMAIKPKKRKMQEKDPE